MPNWCECELRISANEKDEEAIKELKEFKKFSETETEDGLNVLDHNKFVPRPKEKDTDWYNWNIENLGTKWGICRPELVEEDFELGDLQYMFECAWGPCQPVILAMSKKFKKLNFRLTYFECGVGFNGLYECENGEEERDETADYYGSRGG